ncbi:MAG TPA: hypothetical protein ENI15_15560 [Spirochaetes bacterium]|nr:hypothetical protein [Spirochaetota bacterium]
MDAVIFCPIIWTNDPPVVAFIQEMKRVPLIMWAYDPFMGFPKYLKIEMWLHHRTRSGCGRCIGDDNSQPAGGPYGDITSELDHLTGQLGLSLEML